MRCYYLVHFIFGLRPEIMRSGLYTAARILTGRKEYGRKIGVDSSFATVRVVPAYEEAKDDQSGPA